MTSKTNTTCLETHHCWNVQLSCGNRFGNQVEGLFFSRGFYYFFPGVSGDEHLKYFPGFVFFSSAYPTKAPSACVFDYSVVR